MTMHLARPSNSINDLLVLYPMQLLLSLLSYTITVSVMPIGTILLRPE